MSKGTVSAGYSTGATYVRACEEALRRGDRKVGTEHLVLALFMDPATAERIGCTLERARAALDEMDREACAAVGVDIVRLKAPPIPVRRRERLGLTPAAKAVFKAAGKYGQRRRLGPDQILLALLQREQPDPAVELFARIGTDVAMLREELQT